MYGREMNRRAFYCRISKHVIVAWTQVFDVYPGPKIGMPSYRVFLIESEKTKIKISRTPSTVILLQCRSFPCRLTPWDAWRVWGYTPGYAIPMSGHFRCSPNIPKSPNLSKKICLTAVFPPNCLPYLPHFNLVHYWYLYSSNGFC